MLSFLSSIKCFFCYNPLPEPELSSQEILSSPSNPFLQTELINSKTLLRILSINATPLLLPFEKLFFLKYPFVAKKNGEHMLLCRISEKDLKSERVYKPKIKNTKTGKNYNSLVFNRVSSKKLTSIDRAENLGWMLNAKVDGFRESVKRKLFDERVGEEMRWKVEGELIGVVGWDFGFEEIQFALAGKLVVSISHNEQKNRLLRKYCQALKLTEYIDIIDCNFNHINYGIFDGIIYKPKLDENFSLIKETKDEFFKQFKFFLKKKGKLILSFPRKFNCNELALVFAEFLDINPKFRGILTSCEIDFFLNNGKLNQIYVYLGQYNTISHKEEQNFLFDFLTNDDLHGSLTSQRFELFQFLVKNLGFYELLMKTTEMPFMKSSNDKTAFQNLLDFLQESGSLDREELQEFLNSRKMRNNTKRKSSDSIPPNGGNNKINLNDCSGSTLQNFRDTSFYSEDENLEKMTESIAFNKLEKMVEDKQIKRNKSYM